MEFYSLQKIINTIEQYVTDHKELTHFNYGDIADIDSANYQKNDYFLGLWLQPMSSQLVMSKNNIVIQRRFVIFVYDLVRQDLDNQISVWNTSESVCFDICKLMNYGSIDYRVVNQPILTPFNEKFSNDVTGYFCELVIETQDNLGLCNVPV